MRLPFLVIPEKDFAQFTPIEPRFPNWEKSFVSGANSPLYQVSHFIHSVRKTLVLSRVRFLERALGPPGNVHGGATAGLVDEIMGIAVWHQGERCVTQKLELHYGRLLPLDHEALVFTEIASTSTKTLEVHSTIYSEEDNPHVSGQGIFHRLSDEQLKRFRNTLKP